MKEIDRKAMIRMSIVFKGLSIIETPASGRFRDKTSDPYPHKKRNPGFLHEMPGLRDEVRNQSSSLFLKCTFNVDGDWLIKVDDPPAVLDSDWDLNVEVADKRTAIAVCKETTATIVDSLHRCYGLGIGNTGEEISL